MAGEPQLRRFTPLRILLSTGRILRLLFIATAVCLSLAAPLDAEEAKKPDATTDKKKPEKTDPAAEKFAELRKLYRRNPAKAAEGFREFLKEFPKSEWADDAQYWLAMSLERSRVKRREVIAAFKAVVSRYPESSYRDDALFAVAETWRRRARRPEDFDQATRAYLDFIKRLPESERVSEAKLKIGLIYYGYPLRNYEKAAVYFRRVIAEHPKSPFATRAHMQLASTLLRLKKTEDALEIYSKLLEQDLPHRPQIAVKLGMVDCYLRQTDGLARATETCKAIRDEATRRKSLEDFTEYRTREKIASYYLGRKKFKEAEAEYVAYMTRFGKSVGVWQAKLNIGTIHRAAGEPAEAREAFRDIIRHHKGGLKKSPWYVIQATYYLAGTYEREKNHAEARRAYKRLIDQIPRHYYGRRAARRVKAMDKLEAEKKKDAEKKTKPTSKKPDPPEEK